MVRKEIPNDAARVAQLRAGQVDMIVRVPAADVPTLERDRTLTVVKGDTVYVFYVEFDMREKPPQITAKDGSALPANPFRDPRVREAIDLAIDREALAEVAMEGLGKPASQLVTPGIFGYNDKLQVTKPDIDQGQGAAGRRRLSERLQGDVQLHERPPARRPRGRHRGRADARRASASRCRPTPSRARCSSRPARAATSPSSCRAGAR